MTDIKDNPDICIYCGKDLITEPIVFGAGDGRGQKFQCADCHESRPENYDNTIKNRKA